MKSRIIVCLCSVLMLMTAVADDGQEQPAVQVNPLTPQIKTVHKFDISLPLRMMTPKPIVAQDKRGGSMVDFGPISNDGDAPFVPDQALQSELGQQPGPVYQNDFFALDNISGVSPPDPAGDVGPNHYVAMTNLSFVVLDKTGVVQFGPAANNTVWTGFGGACETENSGDPIVLYDQISDRWLLSQFTSAGPQYFNCVAVSQTADPTGAYYRWAILNNNGPGNGNQDLFPDYPKYGVWSDAFYISTRDFDRNGSGAYVGVGVYALNRDDLVNGVPNPTTIYFFVDRSSDPWQVGDGLLPADIDGPTLPPLGSPQFFVGTMDDGGPYGAASDAISFWEFDADFITPANSSFTRTAVIPMTAYDTQFPCGGSRACIDQLGTSNKIDIQSYRQRPLHRLAYRNFGTHESLVTNQSVEAAAGIGGIRWWEIRDPDNSPNIFQEGTYGPGATDGISRWMGSIAQDAEGNMGLAYSASSSTINPAIRFTGRLASDNLGEMDRTEGTIINGTGSQTNSQRWGDYTSTNIDPVDDCTFWHVNEYYDNNGGDWQIRVGSFKFDECGVPGFLLTPVDPSKAICVGDDTSYDINVGSVGQYDGVVTLSTTGEPASSTATFTTNPVPSLPGSTTLNITNTAAVSSGDYIINVLGTSPTVDNQNTDLMLKVFATTPTAPGLVAPADGAINQDIQPSFNWSGSDTLEYTVEVATDPGFSNIVFSDTTTGTTIVPTIELENATDYYWRVRANNTCGDSTNSDVYTFSTIIAPGDCAVDQVAVEQYAYGFEQGILDWTTESLVAGPDVWAPSSVNVGSGNTSMLAVDISTVTDQVLISPPIQLPTDEFPISLSFWNFQNIEANDGTGSQACWDGGILEISTDGGSSFNQVLSDLILTDPYNGGVVSGPNPLSSLNAWCADDIVPSTGNQEDTVTVDLNDFAGETVQFRFRLGTDAFVGDEGWYIDDVRVQSCVPDLPPVCDQAPPSNDPDVIWFNGFQCVADN